MNDGMATLRQRFRERCASDLSVLRHRMAQGPAAADEDFNTRVHQIAGLAGSIGFERLSEVALVVDEANRKNGHASIEQLNLLEAALVELETTPRQD